MKKDNKPTPMASEAFHGIAGEIVNLIYPQTEACKEALLAQFLVGFGNIIGRNLYTYQADFHHCNEFAVIFGSSSVGRKGTSWSPIRGLFSNLDEDWTNKRVQDGFQSGEYIVHSVRDDTWEMDQNGEEKIKNKGVDDKRVLFHESEFGRILQRNNAIAATISSTLRKAWDSPKVLQCNSKNSREEATNAHVSVVGHITQEELQKRLGDDEVWNGLVNRFLWVYSYRSKKISNPKRITWEHENGILERLSRTIGIFSSEEKEARKSEAAQEYWEELYNGPLGSERSGITGSFLNRGAAHVTRLAMIYAALDTTQVMEPVHLKAANAFWQYCERSTRFMLGVRTGDLELAESAFKSLIALAGGFEE